LRGDRYQYERHRLRVSNQTPISADPTHQSGPSLARPPPYSSHHTNRARLQKPPTQTPWTHVAPGLAQAFIHVSESHKYNAQLDSTQKSSPAALASIRTFPTRFQRLSVLPWMHPARVAGCAQPCGVVLTDKNLTPRTLNANLIS
jgi:hypothetical protein